VTPWPLSVAFPLTLAISIALMLAFDTLGSLYTRSNQGFKYQNLAPVQFGLYILIGAAAQLALLDIHRVEIVGAATAFTEATVGWWISWRLGAGRVANATPDRIAIAIFAITAFGFGFAILGALLFNAAAAVLLRTH
jgi:hypothetical protein